jgi:hypothetical protein
MALLRGEIFFYEIGHMGYKKIENFMVISKMQTWLSDLMPTKKVKLKKMGLSKIRKRFFNFNFLEGILSLRQVCFFEIGIKFSIFRYPIWPTVFQEKNFTSQKRRLLNFSTQKRKKIETPQNTEKCLFLNSLRYLLPIQNYMTHCQI